MRVLLWVIRLAIFWVLPFTGIAQRTIQLPGNSSIGLQTQLAYEMALQPRWQAGTEFTAKTWGLTQQGFYADAKLYAAFLLSPTATLRAGFTRVQVHTVQNKQWFAGQPEEENRFWLQGLLAAPVGKLWINNRYTAEARWLDNEFLNYRFRYQISTQINLQNRYTTPEPWKLALSNEVFFMPSTRVPFERNLVQIGLVKPMQKLQIGGFWVFEQFFHEQHPYQKSFLQIQLLVRPFQRNALVAMPIH